MYEQIVEPWNALYEEECSYNANKTVRFSESVTEIREREAAISEEYSPDSESTNKEGGRKSPEKRFSCYRTAFQEERKQRKSSKKKRTRHDSMDELIDAINDIELFPLKDLSRNHKSRESASKPGTAKSILKSERSSSSSRNEVDGSRKIEKSKHSKGRPKSQKKKSTSSLVIPKQWIE
jgi:hypothetical protein